MQYDAMGFLFAGKDRQKIIVQIKGEIWINRNGKQFRLFILIVHKLDG